MFNFSGYAWEQRKLNEVVSRRSKTSKSNSLPTVEFEDINSGVGTLNKNIYRKSSHKSGIMFISGDILFGKLRPYLKNWLHPNFTGIAVGDFWVFDPQNNDGSFIYYLIQSPKYCEISNLSIGSKMPRSDWQIVSNTFFHIPNVEEQSFIGKIIKYIDNLIAANQRQQILVGFELLNILNLFKNLNNST
ncbi:restriction endonuclease subunit S [Paucilactobacillus wasatchensis]|uniref:restriction endonuclease subunit S n=1 Tax=Paucilactobacillus wasatchensis TaxID=1335616 RepID=UPI0009E2B6A7|nr:restriction endonuclease subunit S [Paucilactobacillus wasatchensis]